MARNETTPVSLDALESLYAKYNRREFIHPDPVEFLYRHEDLVDREIVALVASSLAYGRVTQILRSVEWVLERMDPPGEFLRRATERSLERSFGDFKHRFTSGQDLARMLVGARRIIEEHGSLGACFTSSLSDRHDTILPALSMFVGELKSGLARGCKHLLPSPDAGSACKRWNLFLRWMVRRDEVDPGGWDDVRASKLIVPLDVHMHRISLALGLTQRRAADLRTAVEVTEAFRTFAPDDPVRYDFALTRFGIHEEVRENSVAEVVQELRT